MVPIPGPQSHVTATGPSDGAGPSWLRPAGSSDGAGPSWLRPSPQSGSPRKVGRPTTAAKQAGKEASAATSALVALRAETAATEAAARLNRVKQQTQVSRLNKAKAQGVWDQPATRLRGKSLVDDEGGAKKLPEPNTPEKRRAAETETPQGKRSAPSSENGVPSLSGTGAKNGKKGEKGEKGEKDAVKPKGPPQGTFAGRRPPPETDEVAHAVWQLRKDNYESTVRELRAEYPGKTLKLKSANQMKYWDYMKAYMQEHCPKGSPVEETRVALARGAGAYKTALLKEAEQNFQNAEF